MKNILFVCEGNAQRSPSFEAWFRENRPQYNVKSTGTSYGYPERMSKELLEWADVIYCMDLSQEMFIARKFPEFLHKTQVVGCSDQYGRESLDLLRLIEYWVKKTGL